MICVGCPHGVIVKSMDCRIVVGKFKLPVALLHSLSDSDMVCYQEGKGGQFPYPMVFESTGPKD